MLIMPSMKKTRPPPAAGRLRIGDDWNAITIIALSQTNPLKAIAELVENSIDAHARNITIVRGKEAGAQYLRITDDGDGVLRNEQGIPDFKYVATHICDSIKRQLKQQGHKGLQGEFGIGLLSFWILGDALTLDAPGADGKLYQMQMRKGDPSYRVCQRHVLFAGHGTELKIKPMLPGIRQVSGEKIQWYLAAELRDRIRTTGVRIKVVDRMCRAEFMVEPRQFNGQLLHQLPAAVCAAGEVYLELYLTESDQQNQVGLYRSGTRVLDSITRLDAFARPPWNSGCLQGIVDASFLNLTPGTRDNIVQDDRFAALGEALQPVEERLQAIVAEQEKAEEQRANQSVLRSVQKALREALLILPENEYDWFDLRARGAGRSRPKRTDPSSAPPAAETVPAPEQKQFFEFAGPLFSVVVSPASCQVRVGETRNFRAVPRDRTRHLVEKDLTFAWRIAEGGGTLAGAAGEIAAFTAGPEPGLVRLALQVAQQDVLCAGEALITVTDSLLPAADDRPQNAARQGLPGYTYEWAPGEVWRSRYSEDDNLIVINKGHRDFIYAARNKSLQLRYICRLFTKELVVKNFTGFSAEQLLERMIELSLYTEENL